MNNRKISKIILLCIGVIIVVMLFIFGFRIYNTYKVKKVSTDDIIVSISRVEENENQMKATVSINDKSIFISEYSFDDGKTWQLTNTYIITDNRTLNIKLKDIEGNIIGEKEYKITTIDHEGPIIEVTLPTEIEVGSNIDLNSYINATDISGLKEPIIITPNSLDTSKIGNIKIQIKAIDKFDNETNITVEVEIVEKKTAVENNNSENNNQNNNSNTNSGNNNIENSNQNNDGTSNTQKPTTTKKTYYRYRTKTVKQYKCNYYQCNSIDYNDNIDITINFDSDSYCCTGENCTKKIPMINNPCPIENICNQVLVPEYKNKGNICYNSHYITLPSITNNKTVCDSDEINVDGYCHKIESIGTYPKGCTTSDCVVFKKSSPCSGKTENILIIKPCLSGSSCQLEWVSQYNVQDNVCYNSNYITFIEREELTKTVCDSDEINVDGYCHKIESTGTYSCPSGYKQTSETKCSRIIEKTCNETCTSETWSDWSNWSTTKVVESDTVEVQTKQM